ncbi:MAG: hypothetical protein HQL31_13440, partial [Planctomycetes bacterium]|nr:hypothetical protein [Planctomycetota bacterium]
MTAFAGIFCPAGPEEALLEKMAGAFSERPTRSFAEGGGVGFLFSGDCTRIGGGAGGPHGLFMGWIQDGDAKGRPPEELFREYGVHLGEKLRGSHALALYDREEGRLLLLRDCPGCLPLYYHVRSDGTLVFATALALLFSAMEGKPRPDEEKLADLLLNEGQNY